MIRLCLALLCATAVFANYDEILEKVKRELKQGREPFINKQRKCRLEECAQIDRGEFLLEYEICLAKCSEPYCYEKVIKNHNLEGLDVKSEEGNLKLIEFVKEWRECFTWYNLEVLDKIKEPKQEL